MTESKTHIVMPTKKPQITRNRIEFFNPHNIESIVILILQQKTHVSTTKQKKNIHKLGERKAFV